MDTKTQLPVGNDWETTDPRTQKWIPVDKSDNPRWIYSDSEYGLVTTTLPDSTLTTEFPDGSATTTLPDDTNILKLPALRMTQVRYSGFCKSSERVNAIAPQT
jgi:hypothetical protein